MPDTTDAYTHRIGRTGRAAKTGDALTFVTREDDDMVRAIERVLNAKIERRMLADFDYRAPAPARHTEFARPPRQPQRRPPRTQVSHPSPAAHRAGKPSPRPLSSAHRPMISTTTARRPHRQSGPLARALRRGGR